MGRQASRPRLEQLEQVAARSPLRQLLCTICVPSGVCMRPGCEVLRTPQIVRFSSVSRVKVVYLTKTCHVFLTLRAAS